MRNVLAVLIGLGACVEPGFEQSDDSTSIERKKPACVPIDNRSLVENHPAIITDARFGLARVLDQIRLTTPGTACVPSLRDMFSQLYGAYSVCAGDGIDPMGYGVRCRPDEAQLAALDPFTAKPEGLHFKPVAVLGRFDLASKKNDGCGESRIVYWKDRGPTSGRAGLIVELFTPPVIERGRRTCEPIARFWASLSAENDPQARATMLERFFYEGLPGMPFPPISALGAGWDGPGQVRANNFVNAVQWNLREAKWQERCDAAGCRAGFFLVDSKNSPAANLFAGTHPDSAAFQHWFVEEAVRRLARATTANELSLGNDSRFNAFEEISQPFADDPNSVAYARVGSAKLRAQIAARLAHLGSPLSVDNVLDRATAMTCAGCHRISRGADLGGGLVFPAPLGFVHVDEQGQLSPALVEVFLPFRRDLLQDVVCNCASSTPSQTDEGETISGKSAYEPN